MGFKNRKHIIIGAAILVALFIGSAVYDMITAKKGREVIASYNLYLNGRIRSKKAFTAGHDYGYVQIDVAETNFSSSRVPGESDKLFKIDGNKCALAVPNISLVEEGDSICVNGAGFKLYRGGEKVLDNNLILLSSTYTNQLQIE